MIRPDPKPVPRIVDPAAIVRAKLLYPYCAACGAGTSGPLNGHHVLPRGEGGDDVVGNIVCLCGSGTSLCHGAHHGNPYYISVGYGAINVERRDAEWVNRRIGLHLIAARRSDVVDYLYGKLGEVAGRDYLLRRYLLELP